MRARIRDMSNVSAICSTFARAEAFRARSRFVIFDAELGDTTCLTLLV